MNIPPTYRLILHGVVGSTAYNLAREGSDVDTLGIMLAPTEDFFRFANVTETVVTKDPDPDCTVHELRKFVHLITKGNPTVIEALFMADYLTLSEEGKLLVDNRDAFLSHRAVKGSYLGYVDGQVKRLLKRGDFDPDMKKRREKHARHCYRLLLQARELITTGSVTLWLSESDRTSAFAVGMMSDEDFAEFIEDAIDDIKKLDSVLPDAPDIDRIDELMLRLRLPERYK
jgi:hypothetical protein